SFTGQLRPIEPPNESGRNTTMRALPGCGGPSVSACTPSMHNTLTAIVEPTSAITLRTSPPDPLTIVSSPDYPAPCVASCAGPGIHLVRKNSFELAGPIAAAGRDPPCWPAVWQSSNQRTLNLASIQRSDCGRETGAPEPAVAVISRHPAI